MVKWNAAKAYSNCKLYRTFLYRQSIDYRLLTVRLKKDQNLGFNETLK